MKLNCKNVLKLIELINAIFTKMYKINKNACRSQVLEGRKVNGNTGSSIPKPQRDECCRPQFPDPQSAPQKRLQKSPERDAKLPTKCPVISPSAVQFFQVIKDKNGGPHVLLIHRVIRLYMTKWNKIDHFYSSSWNKNSRLVPLHLIVWKTKIGLKITDLQKANEKQKKNRPW